MFSITTSFPIIVLAVLSVHEEEKSVHILIAFFINFLPIPALPAPLTPCLPGHPETVSEEFNGGPLVINPLPAGSSTSFGVNVGI